MNRLTQSQKRWFQLFRTNVAFWITMGIYSPFLSAYYKTIQLSSTQIGFLFAIAPICAICVQPLWAYISDRTGKRKLVLTLLAICTAMASLLYYQGQTFGVCLVATIAMSLFSSALLPLCDAIVIQQAAVYECNFATIRIGGTLGYALVAVVAGFLLEAYPSGQFAMACGAYLLFALAVLRIPMEEKLGPAPGRREKRERTKDKEGIFQDREIIFVLLFAFVESLGLGFCGSFTGVYAVELGHSQKLIGILNCVSALSEVPILLFALSLTSRFGEIPLLVFSAVMISLRLFLTGLGAVPSLISGQLLQSVTYMTTYYCCTRYIATHVKQGKISQGQSVLTMVQSGLASVSANLIGGRLVDRVGTGRAFHLMAGFVLAVSLLVMAIYWVYRHKKKET